MSIIGAPYNEAGDLRASPSASFLSRFMIAQHKKQDPHIVADTKTATLYII